MSVSNGSQRRGRILCGTSRVHSLTQITGHLRAGPRCVEMAQVQHAAKLDSPILPKRSTLSERCYRYHEGDLDTSLPVLLDDEATMIWDSLERTVKKADKWRVKTPPESQGISSVVSPTLSLLGDNNHLVRDDGTGNRNISGFNMWLYPRYYLSTVTDIIEAPQKLPN